MLKKFYPKEYYSSTYLIDFKSYYKKGYRAVLFDIDNTLVGHNAPFDERAVSFFEKLKEIGFRTCLLSNNQDSRVKPFADGVKSMYICDAKKPKADGYERAMRLLGSGTADTLFVGDQIFTDVLGANNAHVHSILVEPIANDPVFRIRLKRRGEKIILFFYRRSKYYSKNT